MSPFFKVDEMLGVAPFDDDEDDDDDTNTSEVAFHYHHHIRYNVNFFKVVKMQFNSFLLSTYLKFGAVFNKFYIISPSSTPNTQMQPHILRRVGRRQERKSMLDSVSCIFLPDHTIFG